MKKIIFLCSLFMLNIFQLTAQSCQSASNAIDIGTGRDMNGNAIGVGQFDANWSITEAHASNTPNYIQSPALFNANPGWFPAPMNSSWVSWYPQGYTALISGNWPLSQPIPITGNTTYAMEFPFCVCDLNNDPNATYPVTLTLDSILADNVARIDIFAANGTVPVSTPTIQLPLNTASNFDNYTTGQTATANLNPGDYVVRIYAGNIGNNSSPIGVVLSGALTSTQNVLLSKRDAGCATTATIAGYKYGDANGNGVVDNGEVGLPGWTIDICNINTPNVVAGTATTGPLGYYYIPNINPGTYIVKEDLTGQAGFSPTNPIAGQFTVGLQAGDVIQLDFLNYECQIDTVQIVSGPTTFCDDDLTHQYCAQGFPANGLYNFQWILNGQPLGNGLCRTVTWPASGGTLEVVATELFQTDCEASTTISATVVTTPSACISGPTSLCAGTTQTYNPCLGSLTADYLWTVTPAACSGLPSYQSNSGTLVVNWPPSGGTLCLDASETVNGVTCTENQCITVAPCCNMQLNVITEGVCSPDCDGEASLNITGGTPPYTIAWSSSSNPGTIETGLCAGNYTVTVTDAACCTVVQGFIINNLTFTLGGVSHNLDATLGMNTGRRIYLFDMDNDGILDLVMPGNGVVVRRGLGNGQFAAPSPTLLSGLTTEALAYADVDNNGTLDLIVQRWAEILILDNINIANTTFNQTTVTLPSGGWYAEPLLEDFDGDNLPELVVANGQNNRVYVYDNNTTTTINFNLQTTLVAPSAISYWEIKAADVDGINGMDVVLPVAAGSSTIHAFLNQGNGTFVNGGATAERSYTMPPSVWARGLHFADIGGTPDEDMIVAVELSDVLMVNTVLSNTNPNWQSYPTGGKPIGIDVADLDNDGDNDVLVAVHHPTSFIRVFINDGTGNLSSFVDHVTPTRSTEVVSGDLGDNCCIDFVTANQYNNTSSIFLNECHDHVFEVKGFVFCEDNCTAGTPLVGASVQIFDQSNNSTYTVVTDATGMYTLTLPGNPNNFNISLPANNYATGCGAGPIVNFNPGPNQNPAPDILVEDECGISVNLIGGYAGNTMGNNCPYTSLPCDDLLWDYCVEFRNDGCGDVIVGGFNLTLPPNITFTQPLPDLVECNTTNNLGASVSNVVNNVVVWDLGASFVMPAGACYTACVQVEFNAGFSLPVTTTAEAIFSCGTSDGLSQIDGVAYNDTCSCDPNYKLVFPNGCGDLGVVENEELTYTVNFANIGAGPAFDIVVEDQLDANLDWSTFQWVGSSHPITANSIDANGLLTVAFTGIILPPNAGGWLKYKIKPLANVANMTTITNDADIYFDSNPAVATNTVSNLVITDPLEVSITPICPVVYLGYEPFECVTLLATAGGGYPGYDYQWSTGSTDKEIKVCPSVNTTYSVTVTDKAGCTVEAEVEVIVIDVRCGKTGEKVLVCHVDEKTGEEVQMCIDADLVSKHLSHGDRLGDCDAADPCGGSTRSAALDAAASSGLSCTIFPNPNEGTFEVRLQLTDELNGAIDLSIYNKLGQQIEHRRLRGLGTNVDIPIRIENQPAGIYFLRLQTPQGEVVERIMIN